MSDTTTTQSTDELAKQTWIESERRRQAQGNNSHITPDNYDRGSVSGDGVFTTSQDFGSASVGDNYLDDRVAVPTYAPIEYDANDPLADLEEVEGITTAYYDAFNKMEDIGKQAAGMGININAIDPRDENQRYLKQQYEAYKSSAMKLGNALKTGHEAVSDIKEGYAMENMGAGTNIGGQQYGNISSKENLVDLSMLDESVKQRNQKANVIDRTVDYKTRYAQWEQDVAEYKEAANNFPEGSIKRRLYNQAAEDLLPPVKSLEEQKLRLEKDKHGLKKRIQKGKENKELAVASRKVEELVDSYNTAKLRTITIENENGEPYQTAIVVSDAYNGRKFGDNMTIKNVIFDPKTKRVTSVEYVNNDDDGVPLSEETKTIDIGSDENFLEGLFNGGDYSDTEKAAIRNSMALAHNENGLFDENNNIIGREGVGRDFTKEIEEIEGGFKRVNKASDLETNHNRGLFEYAASFFKGNEAITNAVSDAIFGKKNDNYTSDKPLQREVGVVGDLADDKYISYHLAPHNDDGRFVIIGKTKDGVLEIPINKTTNKPSFDADTGIAQEELKSYLGEKGVEKIDAFVEDTNNAKSDKVSWNSRFKTGGKGYGETNNDVDDFNSF